MNCVNLVGRVVKDLTLSTSSGGKNYSVFSIAINNMFNGEKEVQFIPCIVWNKQAENSVKYVGKGSLVSIEGSINIRNTKNANGEYSNSFIVLVSRIEFLSRPDATRNYNENLSNEFDKEDLNNNFSTDKNNNENNKEDDEDAILWDY